MTYKLVRSLVYTRGVGIRETGWTLVGVWFGKTNSVGVDLFLVLTPSRVIAASCCMEFWMAALYVSLQSSARFSDLMVTRTLRWSNTFTVSKNTRTLTIHITPLVRRAVPCNKSTARPWAEHRRTKNITVVFQPCEHICELDTRRSLENTWTATKISLLKALYLE